MSSETVERLRAAYAALGDGNAADALAMLAPDCEWRESAELPDAGVIRGRDAVADFLHDFLTSWERFDQTIEDAMEMGERIALVIHLEAVGRGSGIELDTRYAHVWTMRGGLGARVDAYRDPEAALRAVRASSEPATPSPSDATQKHT